MPTLRPADTYEVVEQAGQQKIIHAFQGTSSCLGALKLTNFASSITSVVQLHGLMGILSPVKDS